MHHLKALLRPLPAAVGLWGHRGGGQEIGRGAQEKGSPEFCKPWDPQGCLRGEGCWGGGEGSTNDCKEI